MSDEVGFSNLELFKKFHQDRFIISSDKNTNPYEIAHGLMESNKDKKVCVLIPGKEFDIYGNRKGRGGGWYDRFLSVVPKSWLRIGIVHESKVSNDRLKIKPWDQSVDWIVSVNQLENSFVSIFCLQDNKDSLYPQLNKKNL